MSNNTKTQSNIKQIIYIIFFVIIVALGIFVSSNYNDNNTNTNVNDVNTISYSLNNIPEYSSEPYVIINNNKPNFTEEDFLKESFEDYSKLDDFGRCGVAFANLSKETMPKEDENRKSLDSVIPTGWNNVEYDIVSGRKLYNKCHLIAFSLSAENANEKNIITGTRYFNVSGMLPFEMKVLNYLKKNENNHVLYRVTPIYESENKLASGVTIEIESVEDKGKELCFYVYVYNIQPGIYIDYATGESKLLEK